MKRLISIALSLALMTVEFVSANFICEKEVPEIIETETIPVVFTDDLLSLLHTTTQDKRKQNPSIIEVNQIDAELLMKIARAEGGPTLDGQLWSMRTIFNRLSSGNFGDTIWEIVSADGQFDVFTTGVYINADVNANSHIALAMIEGGWDETQGALYWRAENGSEDSWHENNLTKIKEVEGNIYYK